MTINLPQQSSRGVNRTAIEWADYAVGSPFRFRDRETGELLANACVKVSSGCAHCYAEAIGRRFKTGRPYTKANMDRLEPLLDEGVIRHILTFRPSPVKGATGYKNGRTRPVLFLGDMTDIFGEWVPDHLIDPVIAAVALRPDVDVIVLTKRAGRMKEYLCDSRSMLGLKTDERVNMEACDLHEFTGHNYIPERLVGWRNSPVRSWPLPNLWLYVSIEDQATADERIPHLLACPAAVRGVSAEPLVGPVDLSRWVFDRDAEMRKLMTGPGAYNRDQADSVVAESLDHAIIGGESGPGARPCNVEWIRSLVRQGAEAGVATFVKQLGKWIDDGNAGTSIKTKEFCVQRFLLKDGSTWVPPILRSDYNPAPYDQRPLNAVAFGLADRKGGDPSEWSADLRVRQMPGGGQ